MTLHMLKLTPDMAGMTRWAEREKFLVHKRNDDLGYALHVALKQAFGDLAPRPFALQPGRAGIALLGYTAHPVEELRQHAQSFASPDVAESLGLPSLAGKQMPDHFPQGQRLGFTVRVRPTIRMDRDGDRNKTVERDAYRDTKSGEAEHQPSRGEVYQSWLAERLGRAGVRVEHLALEAYRRSVTLRRDKQRKLQPVDGPDASFSGILHVVEPDLFKALLAGGVGRHAAFGYGMLLLRPA